MRWRCVDNGLALFQVQACKCALNSECKYSAHCGRSPLHIDKLVRRGMEAILIFQHNVLIMDGIALPGSDGIISHLSCLFVPAQEKACCASEYLCICKPHHCSFAGCTN